MSGRRVNILLYAGNGTTVESVRHTTWSLRRLLGADYAVITITGDQILKEPWMASCAMLVMPGGADLGYSRTLNGTGNRLIKQYVQMGGKYLGLCAGGYYGSAQCEFELGKRGMEVVGARELAFFPGVCRGLAFPGFQYHSEAGTRAAQLRVHQDNFDSTTPQGLRSYYNGGGVFVDAETYGDRNVEVLASYTEPLAVEPGSSQAAIVYCRVGEGAVILTGPHPEFSGLNLSLGDSSGPSDYDKVIDALVADEQLRIDFMKACLRKLGLVVNDEAHAVPSLSKLHLSAERPSVIADLVHSWVEAGVLNRDGDRQVIKGENDSFVVEEQGPKRWDLTALLEAVKESAPDVLSSSQEQIVDYNALIKTMIAHDRQLPESKETAHFNHHAFFSDLQHYHQLARNKNAQFGSTLLYGEVVTSTSTLLEKNTTWLSQIPIGLTATATTQVAGRGRGSNVWVSPPGSLMFSTVLRHSMALSNAAPVVFVQYLAALAIVAGVRKYDRGYEKLPIKLKWPNDVYAQDPSSSTGQDYVKIGGILVNSSYAGGDYTLVCGIGLNVNNSAPTTSISMLAKKIGLPGLTLEKLLASILSQFEALYTLFCRTGFDEQFAQQYYSDWLHTDQIVTLETENGARAKIKGITKDWGLLIAEELGWEDRPTGRKFELQSDSNSFDFLKGLLRRKT